MTSERALLFDGEEGRSLLLKAKHLFQKDLYAKKESPLVFLCGGPIESTSSSYRKLFLDSFTCFSFKKNLTPVLSEQAFQTYTQTYDYQHINLFKFEHFIADVAFCIVIFIESEGAIAELGYFAAKPEFCKKLLTVNSRKYEHSRSFIKFGPLDLVNTDPQHRSKFGSTIYLNESSSASSPIDTSSIFNALDLQINLGGERSKFDYSKALKKATSDGGNDYPSQLFDLYAVLEVINLFYFIRIKDIRIVFEEIFSARLDDTKEYIGWIMSILAGANFITIEKDAEEVDHCVFSKKIPVGYFEQKAKNQETKQFPKFSSLTAYQNLKTEIYSFYKKTRPDLVKQWEKLK